jgi:hypothetical protein
MLRSMNTQHSAVGVVAGCAVGLVLAPLWCCLGPFLGFGWVGCRCCWRPWGAFSGPFGGKKICKFRRRLKFVKKFGAKPVP